MTLNIDFASQLEAQIDAEAQHRGLQPIDIVRRVIEEHFSVAPDRHKFNSPQDQIAAMDALAEKNASLPIRSNSAFDRESIYEDRL